jgi:hypothetical protein
MNGKIKYTKKTLAEKAKALQDLDSGMSLKACVQITLSLSVQLSTRKRTRVRFISSIFEFTSLS